MRVQAPEKRNNVLYVRVSIKNKKFIEKNAKESEVSESYYLNAMIDLARKKQDASRKNKI